MLVLDTPVPHVQNHRHIQMTRFQIYKFALFMTRFTGRGCMYLFLATLVFGALWDTGINWFLGGVCTCYLTVLGIVAMGKGLLMTSKLNRVRETILGAEQGPERFAAPGESCNKDRFKQVIDSTMNEP